MIAHMLTLFLLPVCAGAPEPEPEFGISGSEPDWVSGSVFGMILKSRAAAIDDVRKTKARTTISVDARAIVDAEARRALARSPDGLTIISVMTIALTTTIDKHDRGSTCARVRMAMVIVAVASVCTGNAQLECRGQ